MTGRSRKKGMEHFISPGPEGCFENSLKVSELVWCYPFFNITTLEVN